MSRRSKSCRWKWPAFDLLRQFVAAPLVSDAFVRGVLPAPGGAAAVRVVVGANA